MNWRTFLQNSQWKNFPVFSNFKILAPETPCSLYPPHKLSTQHSALKQQLNESSDNSFFNWASPAFIWVLDIL